MLTRREVSRLLKAAVVNDGNHHKRGATGVRNAALLAVLYRSGIRIAEALALRVVDVNHAQAEVRVRRGKGNKARVVGIDAGALAFVDRWLPLRAELGAKRIDPLFCCLHCGPMTTAYCRELLPRLAERAKIDHRVHPHALRNTYAAELARERTPMVQIQRLLGHKRLDTTAGYLASLVTPAELAAVARARPSWS